MAQQPLDTLVQSIVSMSASDADLEHFLKQNAAGIGQAACSLNFETHSLGALYLVSAKAADLGPADVAEFFSLTRSFIEACDERQVKMAPAKCE